MGEVISTSRTQQVLDESVDTLGLSITTSLLTADQPRAGSIYDSKNLAGGVLVHCHVMNDRTNLLIFGKHWTDATQGTSPQYYTAQTESDEPLWLGVAPTTGVQLTGQWSKSSTVPTSQTYTSRELIGACSRQDYLYLLQKLDNKPYLQLYTLSRTANQIGDEFLADVTTDVETISFDAGCYVDLKYIYVFGRGHTTNAIYLSRKQFARVGVAKFDWEYQTETGWHVFNAEQGDYPAPFLKGSSPVTTVDSVSACMYKDTLYIATVEQSGSEYSSVVWTNKLGRNCTKDSEIALTEDGEYTGSGIHFQPLLTASPKSAELLDTDNSYALLYTYTSKLEQDGPQYALSNTWGLLPIKRKT